MTWTGLGLVSISVSTISVSRKTIANNEYTKITQYKMQRNMKYKRKADGILAGYLKWPLHDVETAVIKWKLCGKNDYVVKSLNNSEDGSQNGITFISQSIRCFNTISSNTSFINKIIQMFDFNSFCFKDYRCRVEANEIARK